MHITQRQVTLGLQILLLIGLVLITISQIAAGTPPIALLINLAGILTVGALIAAYLRGWAYAPKVLVVMARSWRRSRPRRRCSSSTPC